VQQLPYVRCLFSAGIISSSGQQWKEQRKFALTALREFGFGKNILQEKILEELSVFTETMAQEQGQVTAGRECPIMQCSDFSF